MRCQPVIRLTLLLSRATLEMQQRSDPRLRGSQFKSRALGPRSFGPWRRLHRQEAPLVHLKVESQAQLLRQSVRPLFLLGPSRTFAFLTSVPLLLTSVPLLLPSEPLPLPSVPALVPVPPQRCLC